MSLELAYKVRTYSSGTHGRAICNARSHHFVSDDAGAEELGVGELFFSGVAACAVNMVERIAKSDNIPLDWMDAGIEAYRDNEKPQGDRTVYDDIRINIQLWGVDDDQGEYLVGLWKQRCPQYQGYCRLPCRGSSEGSGGPSKLDRGQLEIEAGQNFHFPEPLLTFSCRHRLYGFKIWENFADYLENC